MIKVFIVTTWFWDGDSNLSQYYEDCFIDHNKALDCAKKLKNEFDVKKIFDYNEDFDELTVDGQYSSPGFVDIVYREFDESNNTGVDETILNFINDIYEQAIANDTSFGIVNIEINIECHGCSGKGWIENNKGDLKICPICEGEGKLNKEKDTTKKDKEKDNLPWYPWYLYPNGTDEPCWPTYPIITYCNVKTDSCTDCNNQK